MAGMAAGGGGKPHLKPVEKVRARVKARAWVRVSSKEDLRHALEQRGRDRLAIVSDDAAREGDVQLGHRHEGACDVRDHLAVLEVRVRPVVIARVMLRVRAARRVDALIPRALGMGSEGRVQRKQRGGHRKREQERPGGRCRREPAVRGAATARAHCDRREKTLRTSCLGVPQQLVRARFPPSDGAPFWRSATCAAYGNAVALSAAAPATTVTASRTPTLATLGTAVAALAPLATLARALTAHASLTATTWWLGSL